MTLLEKICEELGVEVGEEWLGNDGFKYRISKKGEIFRYAKDGFYTRCKGYNLWEDIFSGELKPVWKPEKGETYYIPDFFHKEDNRYDNFVWDDTEFDNWCFENNIVFKTKEEAIEATNRMIDALKEAE